MEKNGNNLIHSFNHTPDTEGNFRGLTKREYLAGLAMQGILAHSSDGWNFDELAQNAIRTADELLKQLDQ